MSHDDGFLGNGIADREKGYLTNDGVQNPERQ